jgi:lipopolysaccharide export system protein LptA
LTFYAQASELKVIADLFEGDEQKGISYFSGNVQISRDSDELNASKLTIFTDEDRKPTKIIIDGNVKFTIKTEQKEQYSGKANQVTYLPTEKYYKFFGNVVLEQLGSKKKIIGETVVINLVTSQAKAEGKGNEPVIMIFEIEDEKTEKSKKRN